MAARRGDLSGPAKVSTGGETMLGICLYPGKAFNTSLRASMLDMDATLSARTNIWDLLGASAMQIFAYSGGIRWQNTSIDFMGFPFVIWIILYDSVSRGALSG